MRLHGTGDTRFLRNRQTVGLAAGNDPPAARRGNSAAGRGAPGSGSVALEGDNVGRRRSGKRSMAVRVRRRRATRRLKSASSANELGVGRLRHELAKTRKRLDEAERGNARGAQPQACSGQVRSQERADPTLAERRHGTRDPASSGATARVAVARTHAALPVEVEVIEPGECRCPNCGKPYARNGEKVTEFVEVRAYKRRCRRPRYRSTCSCAPKREVVAPPVPRLFANTGLSVLVSDRDLRPSPFVAVGTATVVDARLRSRAGHAGGQCQALRSLVCTARRCNCRASGGG